MCYYVKGSLVLGKSQVSISLDQQTGRNKRTSHYLSVYIVDSRALETQAPGCCCRRTRGNTSGSTLCWWKRLHHIQQLLVTARPVKLVLCSSTSSLAQPTSCSGPSPPVTVPLLPIEQWGRARAPILMQKTSILPRSLRTLYSHSLIMFLLWVMTW